MPKFREFLVLLAIILPSCLSQDEDIAGADEDQDYHEPGSVSEDCVCVPFYLCVDGEIVDDGSNILDPRKKPNTEELALEEKYVPPGCGPYHVCCRDPESSTIRPYEHRCGTRNPGGLNARIVSSHSSGESEFGEWPWQVAILRKEGAEFVFLCGGTLIDNRHIITIAHCVEKVLDDKANVIVRLGEWDTQNTDEFLPHEDYGVDEIMIHPQYRKNNLFNDISVVRLDSDVVFRPNIDTACLPQDDDDFTGQDCVTTGWGTDAYKSGQFSMVMKEVTMPVLGHDECQELLRQTRLTKRFKLYGGFMCAGGRAGEDACKGDGGGPLVCFRSDNSYTVAGLVSWGIDCGIEGIPGVYVNVKKYTDWIISKTNKPIEYYWNHS